MQKSSVPVLMLTALGDEHTQVTSFDEQANDYMTTIPVAERLGITVDFLLADSVPDTNSNILEQFKQLTYGQPLERKRMAINVLRAVFAYFDNEGE